MGMNTWERDYMGIKWYIHETIWEHDYMGIKWKVHKSI